jgi:hypothetical protein
MYDLRLNHTLSHSNRSFDIDTPVDTETVQFLSNMIDDFLKENPIAKKSMIQDKEIIKKLFYIGHWNRDGEFNSDLKLPSLWAPLLIILPPVDPLDGKSLINLGRFYSKLGIEALKRGYALGFQNSLDCHDPRLREVAEYLHIDYDEFIKTKTEDEFLLKTVICIGNKLIPDSPHNWDWTRAKIFETFPKLNNDYIKDYT